MINIKIIAPSSWSENLENFIENFQSESLNFNYKCYINKNINKDPLYKFLASDFKYLKEDFIDSLEGNYDYIIAARGGYGSCIIADYAIKNNIYPKNNATLIGFSDITALHILFNQHYQRPTIHGPVVSSLKSKDKIIDFFSFLNKKTSIYKLFPLNNLAKNSKIISSNVTGGNLRVLASLVGTSFNLDFSNKILILEDVNEKSYSIFRDLFQLKSAGIFNNLNAVIFAEFTKTDQFALETIEKFAKYEIPFINCYKVKNIGHVAKNFPIFFGKNTIIEYNILKVQNYV